MSSNPVIGSPSASRRAGGGRRAAGGGGGDDRKESREEKKLFARVTHTNTITNTYKDDDTPAVSSSSSRVSN